jgi:hypothetical protein
MDRMASPVGSPANAAATPLAAEFGQDLVGADQQEAAGRLEQRHGRGRRPRTGLGQDAEGRLNSAWRSPPSLGEVDRDPRFVPDDPGVVSGLDNISRKRLSTCAVVRGRGVLHGGVNPPSIDGMQGVRDSCLFSFTTRSRVRCARCESGRGYTCFVFGIRLDELRPISASCRRSSGGLATSMALPHPARRSAS